MPVTAGNQVQWSYTVTNTGNTTLVNVTVTDDRVASANINCGGNTNVVALLAPGATTTCTATSTASLGEYRNLGTAIGTPANEIGTPIPGVDLTTDSDPSHYIGTPVALAFTGDDSTRYAFGALLIVLGGWVLHLAGVAASDRIRDLLGMS